VGPEPHFEGAARPGAIALCCGEQGPANLEVDIGSTVDRPALGGLFLQCDALLEVRLSSVEIAVDPFHVTQMKKRSVFPQEIVNLAGNFQAFFQGSTSTTQIRRAG